MPKTTTATLCKEKTKSGLPCKANAMPGSDFCIFHDPTMVEKRKQGRSNGGKARHGRSLESVAYEVVEPVNTEQVMRSLSVALSDCLNLEPSLARARTIAYVAAAAIKIIETTELEQRIAALEHSYGKTK